MTFARRPSLGRGDEEIAFSVGKAFAAAYPELELCVKFSPDQPREPSGTEAVTRRALTSF